MYLTCREEEQAHLKVEKLNNFYTRVVQRITKFEWCQECKQSITKEKAEINKKSKGSNNGDKDDTIFGDKIGGKNSKKLGPGSAVDGKTGLVSDSPCRDSDDNNINYSNQGGDNAQGEDCICKNLCKRTCFNLFLGLKNDFEKNADLFN